MGGDGRGFIDGGTGNSADWGAGMERGRPFTPKVSSRAKIAVDKRALQVAQEKRRKRAKAARQARKRNRA